MKPNYDPLIYWVIEREKMRIRKEVKKLAEPWTNDPILEKYRFCNVRREDDRVTRWVADHIRKPFAHHPYLWMMLCIARQINWPPTLKALMDFGAWPRNNSFRSRDIAIVLNTIGNRRDKIYTGAYMIAAPPSGDKQSYMARTVLGEQWKRREFWGLHFQSMPTLRDTHEELMRVKGWGKFMAYQAVVDMRFTPLLRRAYDRFSWAAAGPGTLRGLNRIYGRKVDDRLSQPRALYEIRLIYDFIEKETGVGMDFSDVPNILCETDKYLRVKNGEGKPRSLYRPHDGSF